MDKKISSKGLKQMKILHIHVGLHLMGGVESLIIELANEMSKTEDVRVCAIYKPQNKDCIYYKRILPEVKKNNLGFRVGHFSIAILWNIYKYLKNTDANIINIHGFFYYYALPILFLHNKKKFFYTVHSDAFMENNSRGDKLLFRFKKYCFKNGWLHPITISPESKASFYKLYGLDSRLITNGVSKGIVALEKNDIDNAKITPKTKVFLHPGRISEPKNQIVLCKVFQHLINDGEDVVLLIAGAIQYEEIYLQMKPFFSNRIKYIGERTDISQLLSRADGFCLPSIWEGLPITLLESLSVGCIPICSPVGGIVGIIKTGINGMLSKSSSEEDYYKCMKTFLSYNNDEIVAMKQNVIHSFVLYDISNTAKNYCDYYNETLKSCKLRNDGNFSNNTFI